MSELVTLTHSGPVAVITIDNPPVNALSPGVPEGLESSLKEAVADPAVDAIVIVGGGRTFVAGADINEFARSIAAGKGGGPDLTNLLSEIENSPKPVVIAIHGAALGGGLELAMAAHYRVAVPDAQVGLPESNLGIVPGAGGTQRLPRLVGMAKAAELIVSGQLIKAPAALELGLLNRLIDGDLLPGAVAFAREIAAIRPIPKTSERTVQADDAGIAAARQLAAKVRRNQTAPLMALEALEGAIMLPFAEGLKQEREISGKSLTSEQAAALIHAFIAERAVSKIPDVPKDVEPYPLRKAAIIGAGTMGGGIAMALANAGIAVLIKDTTQEALDRGLATVRKNYQNSVAKGRFPQAVMDQRMALIHPQLDYSGFEQADIIIEAAFESMAIKKQLFSEIDKVAKPDCVLATNTSTLDIDEIAAVTSRPEMVIGTHFFSPAHVMRLVEIVRGKATSKRVIATAMALAKTLRKVGVLVGNSMGFVGNRMMFPYMREAQFLIEEGATPAQVDRALTNFGMAMGIFAVDDMGGIDLNWRVQQEYAHLIKPGTRQPLMLRKLFEMGHYGQKTGRGWYLYDENRKATPDPEVEALIERTAQEAGIERRTITDPEVIERCVYVMINEGARILEEGYASRASDIDTIYFSGYGFPAYRGGPMWYADTVGLKKIYDKILEFHWEPAPLLKRLALEGKTFAGLDHLV
ncbi:MAG TPA: 3-hydroxyacyl-CoA dehydrogenase NAD-binding domain-containing protein [Bryobacteraceae bacterium]|jgi:3-hydroxyacyl-CoA dehydrogenase|nr:3-hydroxyacyl-CoA dehydrogenase NAD-binding domain-containing protein [Bryobacteraceae bacterium]